MITLVSAGTALVSLEMSIPGEREDTRSFIYFVPSRDVFQLLEQHPEDGQFGVWALTERVESGLHAFQSGIYPAGQR